MSTLRSSRPKRRLYTQSRSFVKLCILSLPVAVIFLSSPLVREEAIRYVGQTFSNRTVSSSAIIMDSVIDSTLPMIVYEKVALTRTDADTIRYAAFVVEGPSSRKPLSIGHWADLLANGSDEMSKVMAEGITSILKESPYDAFRFETKGCHNGNMDTRQFEFVLVDDPFLASFAESADTEAFSEHFELAGEDPPSAAVVFPNLGHDAVLVVPQPLSASEDVNHTYGHCANFVRYAPASQIQSLWKTVAMAYLRRVEEKDGESVWLSTAGTGMRWLHFRLDDRPKYYQYRPFTQEK